jgi:hypothetical protein
VHKTNRFNRKKLHVPPRTVGITADCVQYHDTYRIVQGVLITGLCSLNGLSESDYSWCRFWTPVETCDFSLLWNLQTGCGTTHSLIQRVWGFFPGGKVARAWSWPTLLHLLAKVKNEWSCTSAPPLCLHGMDKTTLPQWKAVISCVCSNDTRVS